MEIVYKIGTAATAGQVIELYDDAGLPRPTNDPERIARMYEQSNLVVSAWDGDLLVGISRSITDWNWSCYLADLAVRKDYQKFGIGRKLIETTKAEAGELTMVLLLSVPGAMDYYPKVGFTKLDNSFLLPRSR